MQTDLVLIEHSDASRFLAPVLQGVQAEISQVGDGLLSREHGKDTTGFLHPIGTLPHELLHRAPRLQ
jgi:hypothetical protein